jgi:hypothetical protein
METGIETQHRHQWVLTSIHSLVGYHNGREKMQANRACRVCGEEQRMLYERGGDDITGWEPVSEVEKV